MKHRALVTLLLGIASSTGQAIEQPCPNGYGNVVAYPEEYADATGNRPDGDVERARTAVLAGRDPTEVLPPTAAGAPYDSHPYLNGGNFGDRASATGCE